MAALCVMTSTVANDIEPDRGMVLGSIGFYLKTWLTATVTFRRGLRVMADD